LNKERTEDPQFKKLVRFLNLFTNTEHEAFQESKKSFSEIMPLLRGLTKEETEAFLHKVRNQDRSLGDNFTQDLLTGMISNTVEEKLAKLSEEENFNAKNRYRL
jgi:phosphoglycerate-specific signal transduction histidine kinase